VKANPIANSQIIIDGYTQQVTANVDGELTVLRGLNWVDHPAFVWMQHGCIHVMGFKARGYLVKICRWGTTVFAYPTMQGNLCGFCGNWNGEKIGDLRLRNGDIINNPSQRFVSWTDRLVEIVYGVDWEIRECADGIISPANAEPSPKNSCDATDDEKEEFLERCKGLDRDHDGILGECAFDQCIAIKRGSQELADKWLEETQILIEEEKQQNNNTVVYQKECLSPWVSIGNLTDCLLFVQKKFDWDSARKYCQEIDGDLAILDKEYKRIHMVDYLETSGLKKNSSLFWLGGNDRSGDWLWLNGQPITEGWKVGQEPDDDEGDNTCIYVYTKSYESGRYDLLFDYYCTYAGYFICQK